MAKRGYYQARSTAFVDLYPAGDDAPALPLAAIIADLPAGTRQVYLVGPRPGRGDLRAMHQWCADPAVLRDWSSDGSDLDPDLPTLRLRHRESGQLIDMRRAAAWFGDDEYNAADAGAAYDRLQGLVQLSWPGSALMSTPARTGMALWDLSRPPGVVYEPLDAEIRAQIAGTSGQGRIELCAPEGKVPGFHYLDGRFMYAALCNELPGQLIAHDTLDEVIPYQRARYRISFTVPADWSHLGLFMVPDPASRRDWHYPADPGSTWETWADGCEVELARARGWDVRVLERLLFDKARPLDTWARKLIELRERVEQGEADRASGLVRDALRNMVLHTIGGFARRGRPLTRLVDAAGLAQYDLEAGSVPELVAEGVWLVREPEALDPRMVRFQHPEWAAAIWARARSRLMYSRTQESGVLTIPRGDVIGMYVDALYLTRDPGWQDNGKPGQFRIKGSVAGPMRAPRAWSEIWALCRRATGGADHGNR